MRKTFQWLLLCAVAGPSWAHDFWLQPARFQAAPNAPVGVTFQIGHGAARERWQNSDRIVALSDAFGGLARNRRSDLRWGPDVDLLTRFAEPGVHVLTMQTNHAFSDLPAIRFNDYARTEGLVTALAERQRAGKTDTSGREQYSRRAKALIQVGPDPAASGSMATRALGLRLEIVADRNPYSLGASRILPVHVLYRGRRLPNATVKLTNLAFDAKPVAVMVTDRSGSARFRVPETGSWLLTVVWTEPLKNDPRADFDTVFSSMTFGYDPAR